MQLGIFAKTFSRSTVAENLAAVRAAGLDAVQFNLSVIGRPTLPDVLQRDTCLEIRDEFAKQGVAMAAISGTFNLIHPDLERRRADLHRLAVLAGACRDLGTSIITLSTGTRDPHDMWRRHPDNDHPDAWRDLVVSLREALNLTADSGVILAFEAELANVVDSAVKARRLLDEMADPRLKIVFDAANLFHAGELSRMRAILEEAVGLLGSDIVVAHAKDLDHDGEAGHVAAGRGALDYPLYLRLLQSSGFDGPLILHGLDESEVPASVAFLRQQLGRLDNAGDSQSGANERKA